MIVLGPQLIRQVRLPGSMAFSSRPLTIFRWALVSSNALLNRTPEPNDGIRRGGSGPSSRNGRVLPRSCSLCKAAFVRARAALILSADLETENLRVLGQLTFTKPTEQDAYVGVIALNIAL